MTLTLQHTGPPYHSGHVTHSTHRDFPLNSPVNVGWPVFEPVTLGTTVVLRVNTSHYLGIWTAQDHLNVNRRSYRVTRRLLTVAPTSA